MIYLIDHIAKMVKTEKKPIDFTEGKVLKKLIAFSVPMVLATLLQVLYNSADVAIVGQFAGSDYQAAVGATSSTVSLIVNLFIGLTTGANIAMAHAVGAKNSTRQHKIVHSSMALALTSGFIVMALGIGLSRVILTLTKTPSDVIDYSVRYMRIYFIGAPASMVYNFCAGIMRGVGETKKPLLYLAVSGAINVVINLITVIFLDLNVIGVALGTIISQYVSAIWITIDLIKTKDERMKLYLKKVRLHKREVKTILILGIPTGLNACAYDISNVLIISSVNKFGKVALAGHTIGSNVGSILSAFLGSIEKGVMTFVSQNVGAGKPERVRRIVNSGMVCLATCATIFGIVIAFAGRYVSMIFNRDPQVISWALKRMYIIETAYILTIGAHAQAAATRGMGHSIFPMVINLFFTCVLRVIYLLFILPLLPNDIRFIYIIYPITWTISSIAQTIVYYVVLRKTKKFLSSSTTSASSSQQVDETPTDTQTNISTNPLDDTTKSRTA